MKRAELEREGKELSELDEQIGVTNAQIEDEWKKKGEQLVQRYGRNYFMNVSVLLYEYALYSLLSAHLAFA